MWAFAVTLWEILTFAREQPLEDLSDAKVLENLAHICDDDGHQVNFKYKQTLFIFQLNVLIFL